MSMPQAARLEAAILARLAPLARQNAALRAVDITASPSDKKAWISHTAVSCRVIWIKTDYKPSDGLSTVGTAAGFYKRVHELALIWRMGQQITNKVLDYPYLAAAQGLLLGWVPQDTDPKMIRTRISDAIRPLEERLYTIEESGARVYEQRFTCTDHIEAASTDEAMILVRKISTLDPHGVDFTPKTEVEKQQ